MSTTMTASASPTREVPSSRTRGGATAVLTLLCVAQFMVVLDVSIVNVALPSIRHALGFSQTALQWVVNAYALTFAGFLLLGGRLGDLFGRRRLFVIGLSAFTASSLLCGVAPQEGVLIGARAVQGLSAALLSPATLSLLTTTFPEGPQRTRAMGAWSAMAAAGGVAGALISGIVTNYVSWRWIFFINVPIGLLALVAARTVLAADDRRRERHRLDLLGALLGTSGLVLLVYGITQTATHGWGSPRVLIPIAAGVLALCAFVIIEWRVATEPLLPLGLFKIRSLSAANAAVLLVTSSMFATWFFMTLYLQNVLWYDALTAGLAFLPSGFAVIIGTASQLPSDRARRHAGPAAGGSSDDRGRPLVVRAAARPRELRGTCPGTVGRDDARVWDGVRAADDVGSRRRAPGSGWDRVGRLPDEPPGGRRDRAGRAGDDRRDPDEGDARRRPGHA